MVQFNSFKLNHKIKNYSTKVVSLLTSKVIKSSGIYTFASFTNSALPFFLLPFLTRHIEPSEFGLISMFQVVVNVLYPFISLNLEAAIARKYFEENSIELKYYIGSCFILFLSSLIFTSLIFFIYSNYVSSISTLPTYILKYSIVIAACQFITTIILTLFQVGVKPIQYGIFQISQTSLNFILTIIFILFFEQKWVGRIEAQLYTGLIFSIVSIIYLLKNKLLAIHIRKSDILHSLKLGLPLIPHALGAMLFTSIDRYIITNEFGLIYTGNYSVAFQIGSVVSVLTVAINNAYVPWLFQKLNLNDPHTNLRVVKVTYLYFIFLFILALISIIFFSVLTQYFIGQKYQHMHIFLPFIILGFIFQGMYFMVTNYIIYAKKTIIQASITITLAIFKIPLTYFLVSKFGIIGIGLSFSFTYLIFFLSTWFASEKIFPMPWNIFKTNIEHV
jgi:O-antigen/teichoic acid export membrane protein